MFCAVQSSPKKHENVIYTYYLLREKLKFHLSGLNRFSERPLKLERRRFTNFKFFLHSCKKEKQKTQALIVNLLKNFKIQTSIDYIYII